MLLPVFNGWPGVSSRVDGSNAQRRKRIPTRFRQGWGGRDDCPTLSPRGASRLKRITSRHGSMSRSWGLGRIRSTGRCSVFPSGFGVGQPQKAFSTGGFGRSKLPSMQNCSAAEPKPNTC